MRSKVLSGMLLIALISSLGFIFNPAFDETEENKRGATRKEDLPEVLFQALKANDFEQLINYIPDDNDLAYIKNHSGKKNRYVYDQMQAEELKSMTQANFDQVMRESIEREINWSSAEVMEEKVILSGESDKRIYTGTFTIQDQRDKSLTIVFDIIKIKNKWFIFQGIKAVNKKASRQVGMLFYLQKKYF
ncbi:MAG: hypothetical protein K2X86_11025 [Cytophagaceae bacterium]|nr:hypothetical protein [Cytophagaceae bacterium]